MDINTKFITINEKRIQLFTTALSLDGSIEAHASFSLNLETGSVETNQTPVGFILPNQIKKFNTRKLLEEPVMQDKKAGKTDAIDHLLMPHVIAIAAIYQRVIKKEQLLKAEDREDGTIFIPGVILCKLPVNCVVIPEQHEYVSRLQGNIVATIDKDGNIV